MPRPTRSMSNAKNTALPVVIPVWANCWPAAAGIADAALTELTATVVTRCPERAMSCVAGIADIAEVIGAPDVPGVPVVPGSPGVSGCPGGPCVSGCLLRKLG